MKSDTNYTQEQVTEERKDILSAFDSDPRAQECLALYRLLPDVEKDTMLRSMDAFLRGFNEGRHGDERGCQEKLKDASGGL